MTRPRPILPGDTVLTAKRCVHGQFRLRSDRGDASDREVQNAYLYCLGLAQERFGIELHEFVCMSNHDHHVLTDPHGNRPRFLQMLHGLVARCFNAYFGDWDSFWSGQRVCDVRLVEPADIVAKCVYVLANPVAAGLVRYAWDWEGVTSYRMEYDIPTVVRRPSWFFSDRMPPTVQVVLTRPPGFMPDETNLRVVRAAVREQARAHAGDLAASARLERRPFAGMTRVRKQSRRSSPSTNLQRRGIRPHVAARSKWARIEALRRLCTFWTEHEAARLSFRSGVRNVEFPAGTFLMFERHAIRRAPP